MASLTPLLFAIASLSLVQLLLYQYALFPNSMDKLFSSKNVMSRDNVLFLCIFQNKESYVLEWTFTTSLHRMCAA